MVNNIINVRVRVIQKIFKVRVRVNSILKVRVKKKFEKNFVKNFQS